MSSILSSASASAPAGVLPTISDDELAVRLGTKLRNPGIVAPHSGRSPCSCDSTLKGFRASSGSASSHLQQKRLGPYPLGIRPRIRRLLRRQP